MTTAGPTQVRSAPFGLSTPGLISGAFVLAVAFFLNGFRHALAPDLHVDELIYASVGQNLATGHGLSVQGQPFFWQPPLFFLVEWPIVAIAHLGSANTFDAALQLRLLNGAVGAVTATGLFALGWRVRGAWTAWAMALLFLSDPFVIRVTRRLYIEPFAGLWILAALWVCHSSLGRWTWRRRVLTGVLFGCALLTKELAAYALVVPLLLWLRRELSWREPVAITAAAVGTYLIYPLWAVIGGERGYFIELKRFQYDHLVGIVHFNGFATPGASFSQALIDNAGDYWTSYVCIGLAIPATAWLWFRGDRTGRFLAAWSVASFGMIAALAKFGSIEDQFFYFLMLSVLPVLGYTYAFNARGLFGNLRHAWRSAEPRRWLASLNAALVAVIVALAVLGPNIQVWVDRFGIGQDHGYTSLRSAIDADVPPRSTIDCPGSSSEELRFAYPDGRYNLIQVREPADLRAQMIHWFVLSSKDAANPRSIDRNYYDYITSHATRVWGVSEHTFFDFGLWYVADPSRLPDVAFPISPIEHIPLPAPR